MTAVLALMTLVVVVGAGMREMGVEGYWLGIVPHMDVPAWLKPSLWGLMFVIEIAGLLIRHIVLAVRLFANMFAGHVVLAVILGFILMTEALVRSVLPGDAGQHHRRGPLEPARVVRGVFAGLHFYLFVRAVHRVRRSSSLRSLRVR